MHLVCLDLEGVLIPEIWIGVAERTGIDALRVTTRDEPDYDKLMARRIAILTEHGLGLTEIARVIADLAPLTGATDFLAWLRERFQLAILSDTFYEFAAPLAPALGWPTLFCHHLVVDAGGAIRGYRRRQADPKRAAVRSLKGLALPVLAAGDSYNDVSMLAEADAGILFRPPPSLARESPQYPVANDYDELRQALSEAAARLG